jgi:hypothetical protein
MKISMKNKKICLLFLKLFDIETQTFTFVGSILIYRTDTIKKLKTLIAWRLKQQNTSIDHFHLYEEEYKCYIHLLNDQNTLLHHKLVNGDIVIIEPNISMEQKQLSQIVYMENHVNIYNEKYFYDNIIDYLNYLNHRMKIQIRSEQKSDKRNNEQIKISKLYEYLLSY